MVFCGCRPNGIRHLILAGLLILGNQGTVFAEGDHTVRSLVGEVSRAELRERGLFIDLGSPDQHKYVRGGWQSGWGHTQARKGLASSASKTAWLYLWDWKGGARSLVMRARSRTKGQQLTVRVNGRKVGTRPIPADWGQVEFPFRRPLDPGRYSISLQFSRGPAKLAAQVDWIWLQSDDGPPPRPAKKVTPDFIAARPSLKGDPPRSYSYYLEVPPRAALAFWYAAEKNTLFHVDVTVDGQATRRLLSTPAVPGQWSQARVDLSDFSDQVIRLDLVTSGPGGKAAWGEPEIRVPGPAPVLPSLSAVTPPRNLIYLVIDTARQDAYRAFHPDTRIQTPAFDAFAAGATLFQNAYTNAPWTKPSAATYLGGLYPATHGAKRKRTVLSRKVGLIQEHLHKNGFKTGGFIANGYISRKFGFKRGWDTYRNYIRQGLRSDAQHVFADARKWLASLGDQRFFLFIQTIDPHVPYQTPPGFMKPYCDPKYRGRFRRFFDGFDTENFAKGKLSLSRREKKRVVCLYDSEVAYHDKYFGEFISWMEKQGVLEKSLVVVSNDHGEELFEHGGLGHGHALWEPIMRTPLALRYPPIFPAGQKVDTPVGLVDFAPTVLEALGVEPMPDLEGASWRWAAYGKPVPPPGYAILERLDHQRAVRIGRFILIETLRKKPLLFDLAGDPGEKKNLAEQKPLVRRACEIYLAEGLAVRAKTRRLSSMGRKRDLTGPETDIDDELREQLNSLGYTDQP